MFENLLKDLISPAKVRSVIEKIHSSYAVDYNCSVDDIMLVIKQISGKLTIVLYVHNKAIGYVSDDEIKKRI